MKHGNFSGLAENYSAFRPGYSSSVLRSLLSLLSKPVQECDIADVGAGTGIWTRMLESYSPKTITGIEPNGDMRSVGQRDSAHLNIVWQAGDAENTGLENNTMDMISMASSFHWADFKQACQEFHRVLKDNGRFVALWNPRLIQANPVIKKIEDYLYILKPDLTRVSSGSSGITETLTEQLYQSKLFTDVVYLEGRHIELFTPERYIGAWRSVNDVQYQLGSENFERFISYVEQELSSYESIEVTYLTRAWSALKAC